MKPQNSTWSKVNPTLCQADFAQPSRLELQHQTLPSLAPSPKDLFKIFGCLKSELFTASFVYSLLKKKLNDNYNTLKFINMRRLYLIALSPAVLPVWGNGIIAMHCKGLSFAGENLEVPVLEKLPVHRSHVEPDLIIRGLCKCSER